MKIEEMSTEELWRAKAQLLEQHIAIPQQLQIVNAELSNRLDKPQDTQPEEQPED